MSKIALHGSEEVLIGLDRGVTRHSLWRRHSFACKPFRFRLRLFPFISSRKRFQRHVTHLFSYDSFFDELFDGQGNRFFFRSIRMVFTGSFADGTFFQKAFLLSV